MHLMRKLNEKNTTVVGPGEPHFDRCDKDMGQI